MSGRGIARVFVGAAFIAVAVSCGGGSDSADSVVDSSAPGTATPVVTDAPITEPPTTEPTVIAWETIDAPADCMCADGSP
ncbi:MAG: hypothetical protein LW627_12260 [Ilumatobacteraceae bacterium]|nr:hypothetical protein [Ilumatobacteraceae bacterium]